MASAMDLSREQLESAFPVDQASLMTARLIELADLRAANAGLRVRVEWLESEVARLRALLAGTLGRKEG